MNKAKINKELFEKLAMEDVSDESSFRAEISKRMEGEIKQQKNLYQRVMYETLLQSNDFKVPNATVAEQAELMRKDSLMRMGQTENAPEDLFPIDEFRNAEKEEIGSLFSALLEKYELEVGKMI